MIHREDVERVAEENGFRKDLVEKVMLLGRILRRLDSHPTTAGAWLLKGGTALNLLHLNVPRLSVDVDLNFIGAADREGMLSARPGFEAALAAVCEREGCTVKRTPSEHAGGKFRLRLGRFLGGLQALRGVVLGVAAPRSDGRVGSRLALVGRRIAQTPERWAREGRGGVAGSPGGQSIVDRKPVGARDGDALPLDCSARHVSG